MAVKISDGSKGALEWDVILDMSSAKKQANELAKLFADIKLIDQSKVKKESDAITEIQNEQVAQVKKTQDKITRVFKMSSQERIDASRKEAEALINSGLPVQTTGTKAKTQYQFGSPVKNSGINDDFNKKVQEALQGTEALDNVTKSYIQELVQLQMQQAKLRGVQKELNDLNKEGKISQEELTKATEQITGAQKALSDEIGLIGKRQKEYDALRLSEADSTKAQIVKLEQLKAEYISLSEAQKKSAYGEKLKAQITSLNTSIKQTQTELNKVNEVSQKSGTAISKFFGGAWSYLRQIAYVLPGIGIAGIISGISSALSNLILGSGGFERAIEKIKNSFSGLTEEQLKERKALDQSASSYERAVSLIGELRTNIDLAKAGFVSKNEVLKQYNDTFGKTAGHAKNLEAAEKSLTEKGGAYIQMTLQKAIAIAAMEEAAKKAFEAEKARLKQQDEFLTNTDKFSVNASRNAYAMGGVSLSNAANNAADQMREDIARRRKQEAIKEFEDEQNIYNQIFLKAQKQAAEISKQFKLKFYDNNDASADKKAQNELNKLIEKRAGLLKSISGLERDAKQSGLIDKEKELDKINEKYDNLLGTIKQLNEEYAGKYPGSKQSLFSNADIQRLEAARAVETQNYTYRRDAENYIKSLDDKKAAFDALEEAKKNGTLEEVAYTRDLYKSQVGEFDNYVAYLKSQIAALSVASLTQPLNVGQLLILKDLKDKLTAATKEQNKELTEDQANAFKNMIQLANTYTDKRVAIDKKYNDAAALVEKTRGNTAEKLYKERLEGLKNQKEEELKAIADDFLKTTDAYKEFSKGFEDKSVSATKKLLEALKALREQMNKLKMDLTSIDEIINETSNASSSNDEYENDPKALQRIKNIQNALSSLYGEMNFQITKTLTITGQQIQQTISQVINLLDETSSKQSKQASLVGLLYTVVNSVVNIATSLLKTKKDMASGLEPSADFAKQVTLEIEAQNSALDRQRKLVDDLYGQDRINGLLDLQDQLQKKQQETFAALKKLSIDEIVKQGEYYVDSLFHGTGDALRADTTAGKIFGILNDPLGTFVPKTVRVELKTVDTSSYKTIDDFINLLSEIKANGGTYEGHVVVEDDIKSLQELVDNYNDLVDKQKELRSELQQIFTGTTTATIEDSIIEGFKNGKKGAEDFADNFQDLMKGALLNSLKFQTLEKPLQNFYEQFANASASDNILTQEEISNLKQTYDDIVNKASEQFKNLQEFTNISFAQGTDSANSLTGAIKGISEQQADLLAGQFGGLRLTALDHLNVAKANLDAIQKIENHTYQLYQIRDILKYLKTFGIKVI